MMNNAEISHEIHNFTEELYSIVKSMLQSFIQVFKESQKAWQSQCQSQSTFKPKLTQARFEDLSPNKIEKLNRIGTPKPRHKLNYNSNIQNEATNSFLTPRQLGARVHFQTEREPRQYSQGRKQSIFDKYLPSTRNKSNLATSYDWRSELQKELQQMKERRSKIHTLDNSKEAQPKVGKEGRFERKKAHNIKEDRVRLNSISGNRTKQYYSPEPLKTGKGYSNKVKYSRTFHEDLKKSNEGSIFINNQHKMALNKPTQKSILRSVSLKSYDSSINANSYIASLEYSAIGLESVAHSNYGVNVSNEEKIAFSNFLRQSRATETEFMDFTINSCSGKSEKQSIIKPPYKSYETLSNFGTEAIEKYDLLKHKGNSPKENDANYCNKASPTSEYNTYQFYRELQGDCSEDNESEENAYSRLESVQEESEANSVTEQSSLSYLESGIINPVKVMGSSFVDLNALDIVGESVEYLEEEEQSEEGTIAQNQQEDLKFKKGIQFKKLQMEPEMRNTLWKNFSKKSRLRKKKPSVLQLWGGQESAKNNSLQECHTLSRKTIKKKLSARKLHSEIDKL